MDLSGDLSKLKVVELKAELAARGLDTKGIKAMLVSRLEAALAAEKGGTSLPRTTTHTSDETASHDDEDHNMESQSEAQPTDSAPVEPSPARPTRRRRTRSTTKSPSPEPKRVMTEPVLEPLQEEPESANQQVAEKSAERTVDNNTQQETVTQMEVNNEQVPAPEKTTETMEADKTSESQETGQESQDGDKGQKRSRENSKSPSRKRASSVEPHSNDFTNDEDEPAIDDTKLLLSWFDSDLHLKIDQTDFLHAKPISDAGLNLVWAGARANHGIKSGKVAYEVYLSNYNRVNHSQEDRRIHEFRCGWSVGDSNLQLGESPLSFGFDSNGKKCTDSKFEDYGKRYSLFDVVGVYLDLDSTPCTVEYTINGEAQGKAFEFEKESLEGKALYPHISTKNIGYAVNFGQTLPTLYSSVPSKPKDNRRERNTNRRSSEHNKSKTDETNNKKKETDEATKKTDDEMWDETQETKQESSENNGQNQTSTEVTDETSSNQEASETENTQQETQQETQQDTQQDTTASEAENKTENKETKPTEESEEEKPGSKELLADYIFVDKLPEEALESGPKRPESRKDCEVILMIGLPGSGKTYWVRNWVKEHPEKRYNPFGVQFLLEKMKINGEARKPTQSYRWSQIVESLSRSLNILLNIACRRRRNYIFDQPNVYANLQRRKMSRFGDFHRKAVIVFPDEETHKERAAKRIEEQGKEYSPINEEEMKSKLALPVLEHTWFNEIIYTELPEDKARECVPKINEEGQAARKKRRESRDDRSRQRYQKFGDNRRDPWRQQPRGGAGNWDRRPGEGYGYGRPDRFHNQWGGAQNNWVRGGQDFRRPGAGGAFNQQPRRQDDRRRSQGADNKRQKGGDGKANWSSNNWSTYGQGAGFAQGSGWAQQWPPQRGQGANGNQYGGTWW